MISVIIPTLNEAATIAAVVEFARREPLVSEVVVIDDGSPDGTADLAVAAGAVVRTSSMLGKGASMEDGVWAARDEILVFLDGDLAGLRHDLIRALTRPIREGRADFVKAKFARAGGRVTALTARPLLRVFFPELAHVEQPLGGIIVARRSLLRRLRFENDYGVDIGLLLDVHAAGARIAEVDVGDIEHASQPLEALGTMANQVVRTLLDRAARYGRLRRAAVREVEDADGETQAQRAETPPPLASAERLALFDMDGTLLNGRFVVSLAKRANRMTELGDFLDNEQLSADERTRGIAALFRGVRREVFEEIARTLPLTAGAVETVVGLRRAGFRVGIVTDSYFAAAEVVRRRVFADFAIAHDARFRRGKATGEIVLSPMMTHPDGCRHHPRCKLNVMLHLVARLGADIDRVLAVGDGDNDACLLKHAGTSVAFEPKTPLVRRSAQNVLHGDLAGVLSLAMPSLQAAESAPPN